MKRLVTKSTTTIKSFTVAITAGELRKRFHLPEVAEFRVFDSEGPIPVPSGDDATIAVAEWEERTEGQ